MNAAVARAQRELQQPEPEAVAELTAAGAQRGMEMLQELNARALTLQQRQSGQPDASNRFNFGIYVFSEDQVKVEEPEE